MSRTVDLNLNVNLPNQESGFNGGATDFLQLMENVGLIPIFGNSWTGYGYNLWDSKSDYLLQGEKNNTKNSPDGKLLNLQLFDNIGSEIHHTFQYRWNGWHPDHLSGEIYRPHPDYGLQPQHFIDMIDVVTRWKRPQHLRFGPFIYMRDHHPLDRAREGIGWMGWVPFALNPSDVPEAALVREMNGGTLIVTQMEFWQAWPAHPDYSKTAIERAQEVEVRLNLLGVLPTIVELQRGDWGL